MEGTLLIGDHLLVNKFVFGGTGAWYESCSLTGNCSAATLSFQVSVRGPSAFRKAGHGCRATA